MVRLRIVLPDDERTGDGVRGLLRLRQISPVRKSIDQLQGIERVAPFGMLSIQQKHPVSAALQLVAR